jgi:long-chain fatty acid transport protein
MTKNRLKLITLFTLKSALLFSSFSLFATSGYFSHGYGTKEKGMGGAGVAKATSSLTIANNPANLFLLNNRTDWGLSLFRPNRSYTVQGKPSLSPGIQVIGAPGSTPNPKANEGFPQCTPPLKSPSCQLPFSTDEGTIRSSRLFFAIPHFGYVHRLSPNKVYGLALYGNGGMNTKYNGHSSPQLNPKTGKIERFSGTFGSGTTGIDLAQLFINNSLSYSITPHFSLGGSVIFAVQSFEAKGLQAFSNISNNPKKLTNNGHDSSYGWGLKMGLHWNIHSLFSLGASYQSTINMSRFKSYEGLFAEKGKFNIPPTYTLGFSFKISPSTELLMDYQVIQYSHVRSIHNSLDPLLIKGQCLDALNNALAFSKKGASGDGCLGGSNGIGFGWEDTSSIKIGYEWHLNEGTYRLGFNRTQQPVKSKNINLNMLSPGVIENHYTLGYTHEGNEEWSLFLMYAPSVKVSGPSQFDPNQTIHLKMDQFEVGFSLAFK